MEIKFFTIPNMLTLGNLLCGCCAAIAVLGSGDMTTAFLLVAAAAVFDFFDGFAARLLHSSSPIGAQLDSLADMVSFGLVPAAAMFCTYGAAPQWSALPQGAADAGAFLTLAIAAFSALRLAKFNIDDTQHTEFCGLPVPANGLFCLSLATLSAAGDITLPKEALLAVSLAMAYLLISPVRMFALKFKGFGWRGNELRYTFIAVSALMLALFTRYAVMAIILLYIAVSAVRWTIKTRT